MAETVQLVRPKTPFIWSFIEKVCLAQAIVNFCALTLCFPEDILNFTILGWSEAYAYCIHSYRIRFVLPISLERLQTKEPSSAWDPSFKSGH